MIVYAGEVGGQNYIHMFVGRESEVAMQMTQGATLQLNPLLESLDLGKPTHVVVQLVESEQDAMEQAAHNISTVGIPVALPPVYVRAYNTPKPLDPQPWSADGLQRPGRSPVAPPAGENSEVARTKCVGCGQPMERAEQRPGGYCATCAELEQGLEQMSDPKQAALRKIHEGCREYLAAGGAVFLEREPGACPVAGALRLQHDGVMDPIVDQQT